MFVRQSSEDFGESKFTFWRIVAGNAVSVYGSYVNMVALGLFAIEVTGTTLGIGIFMALRIGSSFLAGLGAGRLMARFDRKVLLVGADLTSGVGVAALALAPASMRGGLLFVLGAVLGAAGTVSGVVLRTAVPDIVGPAARVRANGLLVTGRSLAMVFGFASTGLIVSFSGFTSAFVVDAATFLISAINLASLPLRGRPEFADAGADSTTSAGRPLPRAGFAWSPVVVGLIAVRVVDNFGSASHQVGMPVYALTIEPAHAAGYVGRFWAIWAVGSMLAHQSGKVMARMRGAAVAGDRAFAIGTCLMSALFILVFAGLPGPLPWVLALAAGVADGFTQITYDSRLQAVAAVHRGRVISRAASAEAAALGLGILLSSSLLRTNSPLSVVAMMHGTAIALALGYLILVIRSRTLTANSDGDAPERARSDVAPRNDVELTS